MNTILNTYVYQAEDIPSWPRIAMGPGRLRRRQRTRQDVRDIAETAMYVIWAVCVSVCMIAVSAVAIVAAFKGDIVVTALPVSISALVKHVVSQLARAP